MSNFKINNIDIKNPSNFKVERYKVTNMERLANASMVGDLIAKKYKFFFTYDAISGEALDVILDIIWESNDLFFKLNYFHNGVAKEAQVYVGEIPAELHRAGLGADWVWRNVTFNLIEK